MTKEKVISELYELRKLDNIDISKNWDKAIEAISEIPLDKFEAIRRVAFWQGTRAGYETALAMLHTEDGDDYATTYDKLFPMDGVVYE